MTKGVPRYILVQPVLTLNGPLVRPVGFCQLLNAPADRMLKKTLELGFQAILPILHSITRLFT